MTQIQTISRPDQIFIYDMPRTRSHLFFKYLGTHPEVQALWHPYFPAHQFGPDTIKPKLSEGIGHWQPGDDPTTYAMATAAYVEAKDEALKQGKVFVANEHCFSALKQENELAYLRGEPLPQDGNPTVIPDSIFDHAVPIFVIRHPVFTIPSLWAGVAANAIYNHKSDMWKLMTATAIQRQLFDLFKQRHGKVPIVVDGDDVVLRCDNLQAKLCSAVGLSPQLSDTWEQTPLAESKMHPVVQYFLKDINESTGIRKLDSPPDPCLEKGHAAWVDKFGQEIADALKMAVEQMMPHYEYMKQFAL